MAKKFNNRVERIDLPNCVIVSTGFLNKEQLTNTVRLFIADCGNETLNTPDSDWRKAEYLDAKYECNVVIKYDEGYMRYGFVWLSNKELIQILIGNNPDGTIRVDRRDNPLFVAEKPISLSKVFGASVDAFGGALSMSMTMTWGDFEVIKDDNKLVEERNEVNRYIMTQLEPLEQLAAIEYTPDQMEMQRKFREAHPDYKICDYHSFHKAAGVDTEMPKLIDMVRDKRDINMYIKSPEERMVDNVLHTTFIPPWMTEDIIMRELGRFNTDVSTETYPKITIRSRSHNRECYVEFSPQTTDARTVRQLYTNRTWLGPGNESVGIRFYYANALWKTGTVPKPKVGSTSVKVASAPVNAWGGAGRGRVHHHSASLTAATSARFYGDQTPTAPTTKTFGASFVPSSVGRSPPPSAPPVSRRASPPRRAASPPRRAASPPRRAASPPRRAASPPRRAASPPRRAAEGTSALPPIDDDGFITQQRRRR
jgi:hypothetical protein